MIDIKKILDRASTLKIAVIGDLIMDTYLYGEVNRVSPEAPIMVLEKRGTKTTMGGAANVFQNLIGLGVDADLYCNYDSHPFWDQSLNDKIFCNPYPFSRKTRIMCGNHHLLRIDDELSPTDMPGQTYKQMSWWQELMDKFEKYDTIVMADYGKGVLSDSVINTIIEFSYINPKKIIVDAKKDFHRFSRVAAIKCNNKEAAIINKCDYLKKNDIMMWYVTQGESGIYYYSKLGLSDGVDGIPVNIVDVCGAGDTVTAALAVVISEEGYNIREAAEFANICASEVVKHAGVVPITREMLLR